MSQYALLSYDKRRRHAWIRTLLLGTYALVTNLANGRTVQVRINDRGPAVAGRVVDLSYAVARQLDMVYVGVTPVKVEFLTAPLPDLPRSQENLRDPSDALVSEAQQRHQRRVDPWGDAPCFNCELRAFVEPL